MLASLTRHHTPVTDGGVDMFLLEEGPAVDETDKEPVQRKISVPTQNHGIPIHGESDSVLQTVWCERWSFN